MALELQPGFPTRFCKRANPTVIFDTSAIEDDGIEPLFTTALSNQLSDRSRTFPIAPIRDTLLAATCGHECIARSVVDDLSIDMLEASENT